MYTLFHILCLIFYLSLCRHMHILSLSLLCMHTHMLPSPSSIPLLPLSLFVPLSLSLSFSLPPSLSYLVSLSPPPSTLSLTISLPLLFSHSQKTPTFSSSLQLASLSSSSWRACFQSWVNFSMSEVNFWLTSLAWSSWSRSMLFTWARPALLLQSHVCMHS